MSNAPSFSVRVWHLSHNQCNVVPVLVLGAVVIWTSAFVQPWTGTQYNTRELRPEPKSDSACLLVEKRSTITDSTSVKGEKSLEPSNLSKLYAG